MNLVLFVQQIKDFLKIVFIFIFYFKVYLKQYIPVRIGICVFLIKHWHELLSKTVLFEQNEYFKDILILK